MKVSVKVRTSAKTESVSFDEEKNLYIVSTKTPPIEGKANVAVIKLLAGYFKVTKSQVRLKSGQKSKIKTFEIDNENS